MARISVAKAPRLKRSRHGFGAIVIVIVVAATDAGTRTTHGMLCCMDLTIFLSNASVTERMMKGSRYDGLGGKCSICTAHLSSEVSFRVWTLATGVAVAGENIDRTQIITIKQRKQQRKQVEHGICGYTCLVCYEYIGGSDILPPNSDFELVLARADYILHGAMLLIVYPHCVCSALWK